jgi:tetratricopeptide (TPR) repeat protein
VLRSRFRSASSILALVAALSCAEPAAAADGTVLGTEMNGYGRLVFSLNKGVKATLRASSGVIVLSFDEAVNIDLEKLAAQAPSYLSVVRRDPDGRSVRFATTRPLRTNLMEAGEKIFLDLMPESWQGLPPSLPADIVEQLARRARDAEEQLRKTQREREKRELRDMTARVGTGPTFTRLIFDIGQTVPVDISRDGDQLSLLFDAALQFDVAKIRPSLPETVQTFEAETKGGMLKVTIGIANKTEMRAFREDDTVIVDFPKPREAAKESDIVLPALTKPAAQAQTSDKASGAPSEPPKTQAAPPPIKSVSDSAATLRPRLTRAGEGIQVQVPFIGPAPAAAFLRNDVLWMVFDTRDLIEAVPVPEDLRGEVARIDVDRAAGASIVRLTLQSAQSVSFNPGENGIGWVASIGKATGRPTEPLLLKRGVADNGRTILTTRLPSLGQIFWMDDPDTGDRLGVVTANGPAHGLSKMQSFVELTALPTAHGLALLPRSEDVVVSVGLDEVRIARDNGLTVSLGVQENAGSGAQEGAKDLLLDVEFWRQATKGNTRERASELLRAAADAPKKDKTEARLKLAQFRLANGDAPEGAGVLKVIEQDDPAAVATKPIMLLRAIAAIDTKQYKEAARLLAEPTIALETEAALWRGVMEARNDRWTAALVGFRQSMEALERYPDDQQARIRGLVVQAAIENQDPAFAAQQLDSYERLVAQRGDVGEIALLRGRIAEQQGRLGDAAANYETALRTRNRGVDAEARLHRVQLYLRDKKADRTEAMGELETIKMMWRRGETEVQALAALGEMYAEDNRWRDAFGAARRASEILPDHMLSRQLHDAMAKRFEALFLEGKADNLSKVEAVGLFYDFRNLMPISRRGDEIVRRLADRLADLDLLDQATELLQHQVENRLGGLMRARVAARLAVLHLLNRKPAEAVQILKATRGNDLPEDVRRGRLILEARGLSELSRTDLALEILATQKGDDIDRLRADVLWRGKRWRDAGEAFEKVLGDRWQGPAALTDADRADVMRSGIAFVLADDRLALDRLRQKFSTKMGDSLDSRSFALVSSDSRNRQREFRDIARTVVAEETLTDFLNVYRQRYPDAAGAPRNPKAAEEAVKERAAQPPAPAQQQGQARPAGQPG